LITANIVFLVFNPGCRVSGPGFFAVSGWVLRAAGGPTGAKRRKAQAEPTRSAIRIPATPPAVNDHDGAAAASLRGSSRAPSLL
jgi:hypothetical protein